MCIRFEPPALPEELVEAIVRFIARGEYRAPDWFLDMIFQSVFARREEVCAICGATYMRHAIEAFKGTLAHRFLRAQEVY
jgi:hypothetical protein